MNAKVVITLTVLASMCSIGDSIGPIVGTLGTSLIIGSGAGIGTATAVIGAAALKLAALGVVAAGIGSNRRKRQAETHDAIFETISKIEPEECYQRLICDLATGEMPKSDSDLILTLFDGNESVNSPKFRFAKAAQFGKAIKKVQTCEYVYRCSLSGEEIRKFID